MKITRQVIIDLLPLYLANEVSAETRVLIEEYLESDPELARIAKRPLTKNMLEGVPAPLSRNSELEAYRKARLALIWRTIAIAAVIAVFLVLVLVMFFSSSRSHDTSRTAVEQAVMLLTPFGPAVKVLDNSGEISRSLCEADDGHTVGRGADRCSVCLLGLEQEDGYIPGNGKMREGLTEGNGDCTVRELA
jgi:hypothetical protein